MAALAEATRRRWWIDHSGRTVTYLIVGVAAAAWAAMLTLPPAGMPGMGGTMSGVTRPLMGGSAAAMGGAAAAMGGAAAAMGGTAAVSWSWTGLLAFTGLWALMMAAMMLPSAVPMIALHSTVARRRRPETAGLQTAAFTLPYAALWSLSGVPVYAGAVAVGALVSSHRWAAQAGPYAVAATLVAAGAYQFSPLKRMCLANCRNPLSFLTARWRPGLLGAARMGLMHAVFCCGCCMMLMAVLVVAGAMGLAWVLLIAAVVALEKLAPRWHISYAGVALLVLGIAILISPGIATGLSG